MTMSDGDEGTDEATRWLTCPSCHGTGQSAGRSCFLCAGSGKLSPDVAEDPAAADTAEMEAGPTGDG
jgi:DnaJ-class molecular chaperone